MEFSDYCEAPRDALYHMAESECYPYKNVNNLSSVVTFIIELPGKVKSIEKVKYITPHQKKYERTNSVAVIYSAIWCCLQLG